ASQDRRLAHRAPLQADLAEADRRTRRRGARPLGDREPHLQLRLGVGWVGDGAEVPALTGARAPVSPRGTADAGEDARLDGARWDVRRGRGWLSSLLGRPPLARPALREDAVRQRAACCELPARLAGDRKGALPDDR